VRTTIGCCSDCAKHFSAISGQIAHRGIDLSQGNAQAVITATGTC
jgi:hypothetical protein